MHVLDALDRTVVRESLIKKQYLNPQSPDWYARALTTGLQLYRPNPTEEFETVP